MLTLNNQCSVAHQQSKPLTVPLINTKCYLSRQSFPTFPRFKRLLEDFLLCLKTSFFIFQFWNPIVEAGLLFTPEKNFRKKVVILVHSIKIQTTENPKFCSTSQSTKTLKSRQNGSITHVWDNFKRTRHQQLIKNWVLNFNTIVTLITNWALKF